MGFIRRIIEKIYEFISISFIKIVYKTSSIVITGFFNLLEESTNEKFIISFWHGDSYCFYPLMQNKKQLVITTMNRRGNYISALCKHFGYDTIRVPDETLGGKFFFKIKKRVQNKNNLVVTLDGPLGPYHEPKEFSFALALFLNYRIITISITVRNKIQLKNRWDNYIIPLPFNKITIHIHSPIKVDKEDMKNHFLLKRKMVKKIMENNST